MGESSEGRVNSRGPIRAAPQVNTSLFQPASGWAARRTMANVTLNRGYAYTTRIQRGGVGVLDFLSAEFRHSGRDEWAARIERGEVEVGGVRVEAGHTLLAGDELVWHRPPWREEDVPLHFEVLREDGELLAVNKPSGLPTVPGGGFLEHTLLSLVRRQWPTASPLHRLGRGTSGLVLFALTPTARAALLADWRDRRVGKVYRALGTGVAGADEYGITVPIGPVPHNRLGTVYAASAGGKPAQSRARVLERRGDSTLFAVEIETGRPHQIRIHLAAAGWPLVGDPLYEVGGAARPDALPGDLGYHLHAHTLRLTHPRSGEATELRAPLPQALRRSDET